MRSINVLIDRDAIVSRAAAKGEPWRFYDLGHGLCTYEFFDQCPHRMACAKCSCYRPKRTTHAQLLEAKANLLHLKQEIPLTDEELSAVDDGLGALERWSDCAVNSPTYRRPLGRLRETSLRGAKFVPFTLVDRLAVTNRMAAISGCRAPRMHMRQTTHTPSGSAWRR